MPPFCLTFGHTRRILLVSFNLVVYGLAALGFPPGAVLFFRLIFIFSMFIMLLCRLLPRIHLLYKFVVVADFPHDLYLVLCHLHNPAAQPCPDCYRYGFHISVADSVHGI